MLLQSFVVSIKPRQVPGDLPVAILAAVTSCEDVVYRVGLGAVGLASGGSC